MYQFTFAKPCFRVLFLGVCLFFLLIPHAIRAQSTRLDNLWSQYHQARDDSSRLDLLNQISWATLIVDPELGMLYAEELLCLSEATHIRKEEAAALNYIGVGHYLKGENETAISFYERAEKRAQELGDSITIAAVLNNQAILFVKLGLYKKAYERFSEGADMSLRANNMRDHCAALNNMGGTLEKLERYEEAVVPLKQAVKIADSLEFSISAIFALGHLGNIAIQNQQLDSAQYFFERALDIALENNDLIGVVNMHVELANLYGKKQLPEQGLELLRIAEQMADSLEFGEAFGRILLTEAEIHFGNQAYPKAINAALEAIEQVDRTYIRGLLPRYYEILSESYAANRQYIQAYAFQKKYQLIHDSIYQDGQLHLIGSLESIHREKQFAKENELLLEKQAKSTATLRQRNLQISTAVVIILLVTIIALISYQNYLRKKTISEELEKMVRSRTEELEESNKNLERFAHITSHDLKEPLRNISGFVQLLHRRLVQKGLVDEDISVYIDFIQSGTRQIKTLIEDVLSFTTISKSEVQPAPVDLEDLVSEIKTAINPVLQDSNAVISTHNLPNILSVRSLLFVILKNLIENGIKYNKSAVPRIQIECAVQENGYLVSVADNGIGIEHAYKTRIFELFQRLHARSEYEGSGLGLAICQKVVQQLGGKIWVESEPGKGSTFFLMLPKVNISPPVAPPSQPSHAAERVS